MNPIEGPISDALEAVRDVIWWSGFSWGALCGFIGGVIFTLLARFNEQ